MQHEHYIERARLIPREIIERGYYDPLIHAAIHIWVESDEPLERFFVSLVLLLSDRIKQQHEQLCRALAEQPPKQGVRRVAG